MPQDLISMAEYLATSPQVILMFPGKQKGFYSNADDYLCRYTSVNVVNLIVVKTKSTFAECNFDGRECPKELHCSHCSYVVKMG